MWFDTSLNLFILICSHHPFLQDVGHKDEGGDHSTL